MRSAPWHVKGINPQARETAREAARRSGMSVGQWLNAAILDQADRVDDDDGADLYEDLTGGEDLAAINARLDELGRQLQRLAGQGAGGPASSQAVRETDLPADSQSDSQGHLPADDQADREHVSRPIADAITQLNGRLDHLLVARHSVPDAPERRANSVDQALAKLGRERGRATASCVDGEPLDLGIEQTMAEIAARQRLLDADPAAPDAGPPPRPAAPSCRVDAAIESLRKDLVEIGRAVADAIPRGAVAALEGEVRALGSRIDAGRASGADAPALAGLEQGLREVRDALHGLAPAEGLLGVDQTLRTLSSKLDMVAAERQDPAVLKQVENTIASLRSDVGRIASGEALAALTQEVRGLSDKIERGVPPASGGEIFTAIDRRIGSIADAIETVRVRSEHGNSPELDHLVKSLSDKLERIQATPSGALSRGEQLALGGLEDRMARLVEKLDASEGRLGHLEAIERGMAELLVHLDGLRTNPPGAATGADMAPAAPVEALSQDVAALRRAQSIGEERTQQTLEAVHDTIETVVDRLARIETRTDRRDNAQLPPGPEPMALPAFATEPMPSSPAPVAAAAAPSPTPLPLLPPEPSPGPPSGHTTAFVPDAAPVAVHESAPEPVPEPEAFSERNSEPNPEPSSDPNSDPNSDPMWAPMPEPIVAVEPVPAPVASPRPEPSPAPRAATRRPPANARPPIDPNLPPDHPLEPGSGPPRVRTPTGGIGSSAAERIAASEGPLRAVRGGAADADPKSGYLQAARRAAQYAAQGEKAGEPVADPETRGSKLTRRLRALFVGASVVILAVAAMRYATTYFESADLAMPAAPVVAERALPAVVVDPRIDGPRQDVAAAIVPPTGPATAPLPGPAIFSVDPGLLAAPTADPAPSFAPSPVPPPLPSPIQNAMPSSMPSSVPGLGASGADQNQRALVLPPPAPPAPPVPAALAAPAAPPASSGVRSEVTGTLSSRPAARAAPPSGAANAGQLPAAIGGKALIVAAAAGEPAAAFEVATRFADGHGVPQNFTEAAIWYERAAKGGLAPALFRLGALYEKGSGVAKDLNEARRFYLAAAEKGSANAMHNIGVLYAEGIDGKPDFKTAAQWFRKSSTFGISDSQYNLAVLYARGIGVERNLNEAYQWFALAAKGGDAEAGKKRDEIAAGLDQRTLAALRHAVDTWVPDRAPEEASTVKAPVGGWDQAESAKPTSRPRAQSRPATPPT